MEAWTFTNHACRVCHGRVLRLAENSSDGPAQYRCAQCGLRSEGELDSACACGVTVGRRRVLECVRMPEPREEGMPEVMVRMRDAQAKQAVRVPRYVGGGD